MSLSFQDIFKSSFLETSQSIAMLDMALVLLLSFGLGLFIFYVYKKSYTGILYSANFGLTLIALCMISALLILAVTSNIVLSLGMVGALSIVRFRTAIKEPSDLIFLFWSIAIGIILAAGFLELALIGSIMIGAVLLFFSRIKETHQPYILIVHCETPSVEQKLHQVVLAQTKKLQLKSKSVRANGVELHYDVRLKADDSGFVHDLANLAGVTHCVLVSYQGDYMG
ncbi:MAG: DUF4956 domain-containing protein [Erysipelotrichaceae bacterium]